MGFGSAPLGQAKADINVTPLIDVLLVLLIIFMVVTPILTTALDADVPRQADQLLPPEHAERQLVLRVAADGRYWLNREEVSLVRLPGRLREALVPRGRKVVFVDADDAVPYGVVVQAMDLCRGAGAEHLGLVGDPLPAPAGEQPSRPEGR